MGTEDLLKVSSCTEVEWRALRNSFYRPSETSAVSKLQVTKDFLGVCASYNIPVFATGGTLLGALRDNAFIEWDDDIDFDCLIEDIHLLTPEFKHSMIQNGFVVRETRGNWPKFSFFKFGEKLSLGVLRLSINHKWRIRPIYRYPAKCFKNFIFRDFYDIKLPVPVLSLELIEHVYGPSWRIPLDSDCDTDFYSAKLFRSRLDRLSDIFKIYK